MSHESLGPQFDQHIADFRDRGDHHERGWHDPHEATGSCQEASYRFQNHMRNAGVHVKTLQFWGDDDPYEGSEDSHNHYANVVGKGKAATVVDWTARQFSGDNWDHERTRDPVGYPHVEPLESYKKRFGWDNTGARHKRP